jgi:regulator of PEP synthase PpsR (kinase-PPPase family)/predicted house-cleaning NTP pyrophosphatase (Maf/HAM1 superfamily)
MSNTYQIYLISDSTGETLDRVFLAIKAQFKNIEYDVKSYFFTRTENQVSKIIDEAKKNDNAIILYTIVDTSLAKFLAKKGDEKKIPCFSVLGNLIMNFSKLLNQKASHVPSGQHALNEEYYERIEAIQFTMAHDDGNLVEDIDKADLILLGVSRTSKTPTSIYLANRGYKTLNIPLVNEQSIPESLKKNPKLSCVVGLTTEPQRLVDIRKNRMNTLKEKENTNYTNISKIEKEINEAKKTFTKYKWPTIDVTRKSVEETAASIIKIYEIKKIMVKEIILASKSGVRKKILEENNIQFRVEPSNVDEDSVKESLLKEKATPTIISKNLAELKANKISQKFIEEMVLGADSVIDLEGEIISKPNNRVEALEILKRMNGKTHQLISSVCISRGGSMIWNYTDKASLTMKNMTF